MTRHEGKIDIYSNVSIIPESRQGEHLSAHHFRITAAGPYMKIDAHPGFSVVINLAEEGGGSKEGKLPDIDAGEMAERYAAPGGEVRITPFPGAKELLGEIKSLLSDRDEAMLRVKISELILKLNKTDEDKVVRLPIDKVCTPSQCKLSRSVYSYLMNHMDSRKTLSDISEKFGTSQTNIKDSFKKYYGESIYRFIRAEKMQIAAAMLLGTEEAITAIAKKCGYESPGKFAKAFYGEMNMTPRQYRRANSES